MITAREIIELKAGDIVEVGKKGGRFSAPRIHRLLGDFDPFNPTIKSLCLNPEVVINGIVPNQVNFAVSDDITLIITCSNYDLDGELLSG